MSLKYIMIKNYSRRGAGELQGGFVWNGPHNFITLGASKGHNPTTLIPLDDIYNFTLD